ncbi:acyltransferase family protein [Pseudomonas segetis]
MISLKDRKRSINFLKGIAILLVTFFHLWGVSKLHGLAVGGFNLSNPLKYGDLGVNLFIFISGMLVVSQVNNAPTVYHFIRHKLKTLYPLYVIAVLFYFLLSISGHPVAKVYDLSSVLLHLTFTHTLLDSTTYSLAGVLWYMGLIIQLFVFSYFINSVRVNSELLALGLVIALACYSSLSDSSIVTDRFFGKYVLIFYLGMGVVLHYDKIKPLLLSRSLLVLYVIFLLCYLFSVKAPLFFDFKIMSYTQGFIYLFFPCFLMLIEQCRDAKNFVFDFISYLGEISYSLYLFNYAYVTIFQSTDARGVKGLFLYAVYIFVIGIIFHEINRLVVKNKLSQ